MIIKTYMSLIIFAVNLPLWIIFYTKYQRERKKDAADHDKMMSDLFIKSKMEVGNLFVYSKEEIKL